MIIVSPTDTTAWLAPEHTVDDVLLEYSPCASVFNAFGVDSCCGPDELHGMPAIDDEFLILAAITPRPGSR